LVRVKKYFILYFSVILIISCSRLFGQVTDSTFFTRKPSIVDEVLTDSSSGLLNGKNVLTDSISVIPEKKNLSHQIASMFIIPPKANDSIVQDHRYNRINYFTEYNNKIIRRISIVQINVFGPSVFDTNSNPKHWFERLGNNLHISTNKSSIRNHLFIDKNEHIDPFILADNERILREMPSIQDARIYIIPVKNCTDSVDVQIVTKDVWPVGFGFEALDIGYGNISAWNNNILGLGHVLNYTGYYNLKEEPKYGYSAAYRIPNVGSKFVSLDVQHTDRIRLNDNRISLNRNIISPVIRFGGGINYEKAEKTQNIETLDSTLDGIHSSFELYDFWTGYAFPLKQSKNFKEQRSIFVSVRGQKIHYFNRPQVENDYLYLFQQHQIFLASVGYTVQGYQNTSLIYGFGDTEDLPYGTMIKLTGGYEWGEFKNRYYLGSTLFLSQTTEKMGYFSGTIDFGGFLNDWFQQGVFNADLLHISPLFGSNKHLFRNFARIHYEQGYNRFRDEYIQLGDNNGIRGLDYKHNLFKGNKRIFANSECVYYSPYHIYGFKFVFYGYIDAGMVDYKKSILFENPVYSSVGIGVRIRNEKLVFNTLQIQFSYFPGSQDVPRQDKQFVNVSGTPRYRMPDFANPRPEIFVF
jgi:hypothetical protein